MCLYEGGDSDYHVKRIEIGEAHTMRALVLGIYIKGLQNLQD
jgi:hypothetical protein